MNETAVQAAIQTTLKDMSEFADADVVINDWGILDQSSLAAPYVIITNAENVVSRKDTADNQTTYTILAALIERFTDWEETLNNMRTRREAIFSAYNANTNARSANGLAGTNITAIRTLGPVIPYYDRSLTAEQQAVSLPVFLQQDLAFDVEEF